MFYIFVGLTLITDLVSKYYAKILYQDTVYIFSDTLYLQYVVNHGIAFSLPVHGTLLKTITILLIAGIVYYYTVYEKKNNTHQIGYGLLIGGALGNAYERIFLGGVTDFIGVKYFSVFNLADSAIFLGILILLLGSYAKGHITTK